MGYQWLPKVNAFVTYRPEEVIVPYCSFYGGALPDGRRKVTVMVRMEVSLGKRRLR